MQPIEPVTETNDAAAEKAGAVVESALRVIRADRQRRIPAPAYLEGAALAASARLTTLLTGDDPGVGSFRFCVLLEGQATRESDDMLTELYVDGATVSLFRIPPSIVQLDAPEQLAAVVLFACRAYIDAVDQETGGHDWGTADPVGDMARDAMTMSAEEIRRAARLIWN